MQLVELPAALGQLRMLEELEAGQNQLRRLPDSIGGCSGLVRLDCRQNQLGGLPPSLIECVGLKELYVGINELTEDCMPALGDGLPALAILDLSDNGLACASAAVGLRSLERLDLRNNELGVLDPRLGLLPKLRWVGLEGNPIRSLRRELVSGPCSELMKFLRTRLEEAAVLETEPWAAGSPFDELVREAAATGVLGLEGREATEAQLPQGCLALPDLHTLRLANNMFAGLSGLPLAATLVEVSLARNKIEVLPSALGELVELQRLDVSYNPLRSIQPIPALRGLVSLNITAVGSRSGGGPVVKEILSLCPPAGCAACLEEFLCGFNRLPSVPNNLRQVRWPALQTVELANNAVAEAAPSWFGPQDMPSLSSLNLENNEIGRLAPEFGLLTSLKCLMVAGNPQRGVVRDPATWTVLQHDGPYHHGL